LPRFSEWLSFPTQPDLAFRDEIDGRVRVIACPTTLPATRELPQPLRESMGMDPGDGALLFAASPDDIATASQEIVIRVREAFEGVPSETRQALPGGRTTFERILPGPDRMYPDTDLPPEPVSPDLVDRIAASLSERPDSRRTRYAALGVPEQLISRLINWESADMFDSISAATGYAAPQLAWFLTDRRRGSRRAGADWMDLGEDRLRSAVVGLFEMGLSLRAAAEVLDRMSRGGLSLEDAVAEVEESKKA